MPWLRRWVGGLARVSLKDPTTLNPTPEDGWLKASLLEECTCKGAQARESCWRRREGCGTVGVQQQTYLKKEDKKKIKRETETSGGKRERKKEGAALIFVALPAVLHSLSHR